MADKGFLKKWNSYKVEDNNITVSPQKKSNYSIQQILNHKHEKPEKINNSKHNWINEITNL